MKKGKGTGEEVDQLCFIPLPRELMYLTLLPVYLHVSAIGFAAAFGGGGAAVLPFAIGALAQAKGVAVLEPVLLAILVMLFILWICLPTIDKSRPGEVSSESNKCGQWISIDFDLVATGRRTIQKARGGG